ncbi:MAG: lipoyl(octanoyl) transferase LipB [Actinomycetota bacterium]
MNPLKVVRAGVVPYRAAYAWQKELHRRRLEGAIPDVLLLLEHPHVYTLGRRFDEGHLLLSKEALEERGIEVFEADRGGSITYHGPGQLVGYPILDLRRPADPPGTQPDAIVYLRRLEEAIIRAVRSFGMAAARREGLTGVWMGERKLAAIGVNVSRGASKHGFALNVTTDLSYFEGMVPCGMPDARPTSMEEVLVRAPSMESVTKALVAQIARIFHRVPIDGTLADFGLEATSEKAVAPTDTAEVVELKQPKDAAEPVQDAAGE